MDKREFLFHDTQDIPALREEFLPRYYLEDNEFIPEEHRRGRGCPRVRASICSACWRETRGSKVRLYVPQRGDTAQVWWRWRAPTPCERLGARERALCPRTACVWTKRPRLLGLAAPPQRSSRATTSPTGATAPAWPAWWCLRTANPKRPATAASRCTRVPGTDDYASMAETLARRAAEYEKGANRPVRHKAGPAAHRRRPRPGRPPCSAALAGTRLADVPVFGMVKDSTSTAPAALWSAAGRENHALAMHRGRLHLRHLHSGRDAPLGQRLPQQRMQKGRAYSSTLQSGAGRRPGHQPSALMAHFKTVSAVKQASEEQLAGAKGVSRAAARAVYAHFHPQPEQPSAET